MSAINDLKDTIKDYEAGGFRNEGDYELSVDAIKEVLNSSDINEIKSVLKDVVKLYDI